MNTDTTQGILDIMQYYCIEERLSVVLWDQDEERPYGRWTKFQKERQSYDELSKTLLTSDLNLGLAIICGEVSEFLEVIDIDEKNCEGIAKTYFDLLIETDKQLLSKIRIHATRNGGFHLLYRCKDIAPEDYRNQALAKILIDDGVKPKIHPIIETRGEGGLIYAPGSTGYRVVRDIIIPTITLEERNLLFSVARSLNKLQEKKEVEYEESHYDSDSIYVDNHSPFQEFNRSNEAKELLLNDGWKKIGSSGNFINYRRPGKDKGNSASYMQDSGCYWIFTTSTHLPSGKLLDPSELLCRLKFNGDYKALYEHLTNHGYGTLKPEVEKRIVSKVVSGQKVNIPKNISSDAKVDIEKSDISDAFPFGTFWEFTDKGVVKYFRNRLIDVSIKLGFRNWKGIPVRIIDGVFYERLLSKGSILAIFKKYLNEKHWINNDIHKDYEKLFDAHDKFMENHLAHFIYNLPEIGEHHILRDTYNMAFAVTPNYIVAFNSENIWHIPVNDIKYKKVSGKNLEVYNKYIHGKYIDIDTIQPFDWEYIPPEESVNTKWPDFIDKATAIPVDKVQKLLGYMLYNYRSASESYFICMIDERDAKEGGGTGKGVTASMLHYWTPACVVQGETIAKDFSLLLQTWNGERIVAIDDLTKYGFLNQFKSSVSKGMMWKRLFKDIVQLTLEESPKIILDGQFGMDFFTDGGVKRRAIMLPFSGTLFSGVDGVSVEEHYGGDFPDCWTEEDWNGFYSWCVDSIRLYMGDRRLHRLNTTTDKGWKKFYDYTYEKYGGELFRTWVMDSVDKWVAETKNKGGFSHEDLLKQYRDFVSDNNLRNQMASSKLHGAIIDILDYEGYEYIRGRDRTTLRSYGNSLVRYQQVFKSKGFKDEIIDNETDRKTIEDYNVPDSTNFDDIEPVNEDELPF